MKYNKKIREQGKTELEQLHLVLLEMLKVIDDICQRNNLEYWLDAGNLLGYKRHNGFIPWDDDIDLCMKREDYELFCKIAPQELPKELFFQAPKSDKRKNKWVKIRDNFSTVISAKDQNKEVKYHQGIFIDIFPYDILNKEFKTTKMVINRKFKRSKHQIIRTTRFIPNFFVTIFIKLIGFNKVKRYYIKKHMGHNPQYISTGIEISNFYFTFDYDTIFPLAEINFAGINTYAPNNINAYLENMYGDYMKIPESKKRKTHAIEIKPFTKCNHPVALDY